MRRILTVRTHEVVTFRRYPLARRRLSTMQDQLLDPRLYFNRHLSWLRFNERVLEEARDTNNPLLERGKFLAITASNLDEFVEVRVAGLLQQVEHGNSKLGPDGKAPEEVVKELSQELHGFVDEQYRCWQH